jgi:hypothetical protein
VVRRVWLDWDGRDLTLQVDDDPRLVRAGRDGMPAFTVETPPIDTPSAFLESAIAAPEGAARRAESHWSALSCRGADVR